MGRLTRRLDTARKEDIAKECVGHYATESRGVRMEREKQQVGAKGQDIGTVMDGRTSNIIVWQGAQIKSRGQCI